MARVILAIIIAVACPLIWTMILVPLIGRCFGVPIKIGSLPIDKRDPRLSKSQSFWFGGILGWGIGVSLMGLLTLVLIDQKQITISTLFIGVASSTIYGGLNSLWDWTYPLD